MTHGEHILFCKRAIEPRKGTWTLPAGFMENRETVAQAAARETWEEACAKVANMHPYTLFNLPHVNQVYIIYRAELLDGKYSPGEESTDVRLYLPDEIPWEKLSFPTIRETLRLYVSDLKKGRFRVHHGDIIRPWVLKNPGNAYLANLVSH